MRIDISDTNYTWESFEVLSSKFCGLLSIFWETEGGQGHTLWHKEKEHNHRVIREGRHQTHLTWCLPQQWPLPDLPECTTTPWWSGWWWWSIRLWILSTSFSESWTSCSGQTPQASLYLTLSSRLQFRHHSASYMVVEEDHKRAINIIQAAAMATSLCLPWVWITLLLLCATWYSKPSESELWPWWVCNFFSFATTIFSLSVYYMVWIEVRVSKKGTKPSKKKSSLHKQMPGMEVSASDDFFGSRKDDNYAITEPRFLVMWAMKKCYFRRHHPLGGDGNNGNGAGAPACSMIVDLQDPKKNSTHQPQCSRKRRTLFASIQWK